MGFWSSVGGTIKNAGLEVWDGAKNLTGLGEDKFDKAKANQSDYGKERAKERIEGGETVSFIEAVGLALTVFSGGVDDVRKTTVESAKKNSGGDDPKNSTMMYFVVFFVIALLMGRRR